MCQPTNFQNNGDENAFNNSNETTPAPQTLPKKADHEATKGHPQDLDSFYKTYPSFAWGPIVVSAFLFGLGKIPVVNEYFSKHEMTAFGWEAALKYTVFAIVSSYAFHGWCSVHADHSLKIQSGKLYPVSPQAMAVRSTAALMTEMIYTFMPLAPDSTSWVQFAVWTAIVGVYWDAHFYFAHRWAHENKWAYTFFHKTHHLVKDPNCFGAYFVTYQSHILLEQIVVFIMAMCGMPRDVFMFVMYYGTIATYLEHSGYEFGHMKLPFVPYLKMDHVMMVLGLPTVFLSGVSVAEHDWHHEKFLQNYGLSFKYLDKIFGTYHPGRVPGEQQLIKPKSEVSKSE
mmetsp:Transcript_1130/g.1770  ORF Transcript_1130/g.1770 Transcript_1130/m.1770 type:complete len:341 (+) Transcript_1130:61-1083(+)|eukprot:CAMPEP_0178770040 /NCGR_PEP_ID=MMETSP0744-20121128/21168_1 /TAXON_ID=913974 /ORGANISM="Nitzschia punctata, Strain CCMP561" /LENGTH=340 /DNA_ID=CAMNT_0020426367 /DNA_START=37 /DNA_END=1059 /DNA_ORIENTATION=+